MRPWCAPFAPAGRTSINVCTSSGHYSDSCWALAGRVGACCNLLTRALVCDRACACRVHTHVRGRLDSAAAQLGSSCFWAPSRVQPMPAPMEGLGTSLAAPPPARSLPAPAGSIAPTESLRTIRALRSRCFGGCRACWAGRTRSSTGRAWHGTRCEGARRCCCRWPGPGGWPGGGRGGGAAQRPPHLRPLSPAACLSCALHWRRCAPPAARPARCRIDSLTTGDGKCDMAVGGIGVRRRQQGWCQGPGWRVGGGAQPRGWGRPGGTGAGRLARRRHEP